MRDCWLASQLTFWQTINVLTAIRLFTKNRFEEKHAQHIAWVDQRRAQVRRQQSNAVRIASAAQEMFVLTAADPAFTAAAAATTTSGVIDKNIVYIIRSTSARRRFRRILIVEIDRQASFIIQSGQ